MSIPATNASSFWVQSLGLSGAGPTTQKLTSAQRAAFSHSINAAQASAPTAQDAEDMAALLPGAASAPLTPSTGFYTQSIAQGDTQQAAAGLSDGSAAAGESTQQKFLDYARETPMQRMRDQVLHDMGMTEDDVRNMSPADREKVEAKIREKIQELMKKKLDGMAAKDPSDTVLADLSSAA